MKLKSAAEYKYLTKLFIQCKNLFEQQELGNLGVRMSTGGRKEGQKTEGGEGKGKGKSYLVEGGDTKVYIVET